MATIEETTEEILNNFIENVDKQIARISTAATNIATAIENQGVTVPSGTTIDGYASLIGQISGGSSNFACGYVTLDSDVTTTGVALTITHGMGVVPDYIYFGKVDKTHNAQTALVSIFGSNDGLNKYSNTTVYMVYEYQSASSYSRSTVTTHNLTSTSYTTGISAATTSSFRIGLSTTSYPLRAGSYLWFAVAVDAEEEEA